MVYTPKMEERGRQLLQEIRERGPQLLNKFLVKKIRRRRLMRQIRTHERELQQNRERQKDKDSELNT